MFNFALAPRYAHSPVGLILTKYLKVIFKESTGGQEHAQARKQLIMALLFPEKAYLPMTQLLTLPGKDFEEALYLLREFREANKPLSVYFIEGAEIFSSPTFARGQLPKKFNPEDYGFLTPSGRVALPQLEVEDLLQVACQGLEALRVTPVERYSTEALVNSWKSSGNR